MNRPTPRTQERKVACARNEWKARSPLSVLVQRLGVSGIALRIDSRSCYINPSSPPPPPPALFKFPQQLQGSALFPLLAVGNHLHPCMENFLTDREVEERADTAPPAVERHVTGALQ